MNYAGYQFGWGTNIYVIYAADKYKVCGELGFITNPFKVGVPTSCTWSYEPYKWSYKWVR